MLDVAMVAASLELAPAGANAESLVNAGGRPGIAHLDFAIVIPSILVLDTASGLVYTNDKRSNLTIGMSAGTPLSIATGSHRAQGDVELVSPGPVLRSSNGKLVGGDANHLLATPLHAATSGVILCVP